MDYHVCTHWNVRDLLRMQSRSQLTPPREFQRGPKWSRTQKKLYIDSLLRGYPSPAFYFHCDDPDAVIRRDTRLGFGVVDGQQRLNAMGEFGRGEWALLKSPETRPGGSKHFPVETAHHPEPEWCGLRFDRFSDALRIRFASLTLPVIVIKTTDLTVVRDLFIRLQAGTALSAQERRDAWPGEFPEYIKRLGGHPHGSSGLRVFREFLKGKDDAHRRVAAQSFLIWSHWVGDGGGDFPEISSERVDDLYRQSTSFKDDSREAKRFEMLLSALGRVLEPRRGKWPEWMVLHMVVLLEELDRREVMTLKEIFARESGAGRKLYSHLHTFTELVAEAADGAKIAHWSNEQSQKTYQQFQRYIQNDASASNSLRTRHRFLRGWFWERLTGSKAPEDDLPPQSWPEPGEGGEEMILDF